MIYRNNRYIYKRNGMIIIMNIRRIFLSMAVLCGFSGFSVAGERFDKLSDRGRVASEPAEGISLVCAMGSNSVPEPAEGTVVRQGSPTIEGTGFLTIIPN